MNQNLEERGRSMLRTVHDTAPTCVPATGGPESTVAGQRDLVADPPEEHLCGHALVNPVQEFLDEASASFSRQHLEWTTPAELPLTGSGPLPRPFLFAEHVLREGGDTGDADDPVGFLSAERLAASASMGQRPARHHEGVQFVVVQATTPLTFEGLRRQPLFDQPDQFLVRSER
jgi:hypothetical protein